MNLFENETVQAAGIEEAQRMAAYHRSEAVKLLMESHSGRIFVRGFLDFCGVFADPCIKTNEHLQFSEGMRRAGMYIFNSILTEDAAHITTIFKEQQ